MAQGKYIITEAWRKIRSRAQKKLWKDPEYRKKMSLAHVGNKAVCGPDHPNWRGGLKINKTSFYSSIHQWARKNMGQPKTCEFCKKTGLVGRKIHWANKSKTYKKDKNDWIRLCVPCHSRYDKKFYFK